jgi:hypothetical protein
MKSDQYTLRDYINTQIYEIGELLIKLEIVRLSEDKMKYIGSLFIEQYYEFIHKNLKELPTLFADYLSQFSNKYQQQHFH